MYVIEVSIGSRPVCPTKTSRAQFPRFSCIGNVEKNSGGLIQKTWKFGHVREFGSLSGIPKQRNLIFLQWFLNPKNSTMVWKIFESQFALSFLNFLMKFSILRCWIFLWFRIYFYRLLVLEICRPILNWARPTLPGIEHDFPSSVELRTRNSARSRPLL